MASSSVEWLQDMLQQQLDAHPGWPGIQITLSSPSNGLKCTASVQSKDPQFANEPALLDDTLWRLASITKTFTSVATLRLVEEGRLDIEDPAIEYLPDWAVELVKQSQGTESASQITTWHLLHHTSGLGDFASDPRWAKEMLDDPQQTWTQRSLLEWSTLNSQPVGYPGENYSYSDTGYTLLGLILEKITDKKLAAAVRELTTLDELDMPSTWWEQLEEEPQNAMKRAGQYYKDIDTTNFNPTFDLFGAGGLIGNSQDLNEFGRAMLEGRILNAESMKRLYTLGPSSSYASGVVRYSLAGHEAWGHTGFWGTWLFWVPSIDLVISGASNKAREGDFDADAFVKSFVKDGRVTAQR